MTKAVPGAVLALIAILGASCFGVEFRRADNTLDDVFSASCRVNVSGARGSGTFNGEKDGLAYISTNYHVVSGQKNATVDFWTNGVKQTLAGRVVWRAYDANMPADFAFIVVDAEELKRTVDPPYVALGGSDAKPSVNSFFLSSGGPKGWAVKAWKGKVLDYYNGETVLFQPHPVPGQSGSGVFEEIDDELFQVGIITWLIGSEGDDAAKGGAIPISNLYKALKQRPYQVGFPSGDKGSPIPPGAVECQRGALDPFFDYRRRRAHPSPLATGVNSFFSDESPSENSPNYERNYNGGNGKCAIYREAERGNGGTARFCPVTFESARTPVQDDGNAALGSLFTPDDGDQGRVVSFKEIAETTPGAQTTTLARVLYFSAKDCPACALIAPEIDQIVAAGTIPFEIVDASSENGSLRATAYGVEFAPTALVIDYRDTERARVSFEEMKVRTAAVAIANAYDATIQEIKRENAQAQRERAVIESADLGTAPAPAPESASKIETKEDFRARAAHYDTPPDVGFFDDSETRWRRRGGDSGNAPEPAPKNDEPKEKPDSRAENDDSARSPRLFDKLGDRLEERLSGVIKRASGEAAGEIAEQLEGRFKDALGGDVSKLMSGLESGIQSKLESGAKSIVRKYAWRAFWGFLGAFLGAQIVYALLRRFFKGILSKVKTTMEALAAGYVAQAEKTTIAPAKGTKDR